MILRLLILTLGASAFAASPDDNSDLQRAKQLKEFIQKEKPRFEQRETQRKGILEELDRLNVGQNNVRQRISAITMNHQELQMALDNMAMEVKKQRDLEIAQKQRLLLLMKVVYKIKKDGIIRFVVNGDDLGAVAGRIRILYRTLRSHSQLTQQLEDRANRLAESEKKLGVASVEVSGLLAELKEQETLLDKLLSKKHVVLRGLNQKQTNFQGVMREYRQVSKHITSLFDNFESMRETPGAFPSRRSLPVPVELGRVVKNFGRSVHEKFHTVTYQKGIEIEADHNTPVAAILPGVVEYEGWVKGLGNVLIVHHGGGFYSLSAHLFKTMKTQGARVAQGETIGYVGDTGNNEKPSLYFEIRENGKAVDPLTYFSPQALASLNSTPAG